MKVSSERAQAKDPWDTDSGSTLSELGDATGTPASTGSTQGSHPNQVPQKPQTPARSLSLRPPGAMLGSQTLASREDRALTCSDGGDSQGKARTDLEAVVLQDEVPVHGDGDFDPAEGLGCAVPGAVHHRHVFPVRSEETIEHNMTRDSSSKGPGPTHFPALSGLPCCTEAGTSWVPGSAASSDSLGSTES